MKTNKNAERLVNNLINANDALWRYGTKREAIRVGMRTNQLVKHIRRLEKYIGRLKKRIEKYEQQANL